MAKSVFLRPLALGAQLLILSGCAGAPDPKPAVCDGEHRRPANPYGSVLPTAPAPDGTLRANAPQGPSTTPASPAAAAPLPGPRAALDPRSFAPCGEGA